MSEALQGERQVSDPAHATPLHVFAAALIGTPFDTSSARVIALVAYAQREAAQRIAAGRAPVEKRSLLPYAVLYRELRAEAARASPPSVPKSASLRRRVLAAVCALRHRQRAVLLLRYCAGFFFEEVGEAVGTTARQAEEIAHAAAGRVAAALGRPVDLASSLRIRKPPQRAAPKAPRLARLPRSVVRTLVAPPPEGVTPSAPAPTPVEAIVRPAELVRIPIREPIVVAPKPRRSWKARTVMAAAAIVVLSLALVPVGASNPTPPPPEPAALAHPVTPVTVSAPAPAVAAPMAVVKRGDSLWAIAGRALGRPERWREIWSLNLGRIMTSGERFIDPDLIRPGWRLRLPAR